MLQEVRYPLVEEISTLLSPDEAFDAFRDRPFSFYLDGGMDPQRLGTFSFMGSDPYLVLRSRARRVTLTGDGDEHTVYGNPFDVLGDLLNKYRLDSGSSPLPLNGGAVGYLSYDLCRFLERVPDAAKDDLRLPECYFGFYDVVLAFDNLHRRAYIVSTGFPALRESERMERARRRLEEVRERLGGAIRVSTSDGAEPSVAPVERVALTPNFTHEGYLHAVQRARQYIIDGDIFEVNLSQRFESDLPMTPYELYGRLKRVNPAPFASYLGFDEVSVVSASPERFLRLRGDRVETRPIKGTRPRGKTPGEDEALARELLSSEKDRAENIMIVDLERNDLGRVCRFGTVRVTELNVLETFPTVFHLTSTVEGRLRPGVSGIDLLKATFPGGSITGAPKVRAMEIIDELEPTRRSVYTGSIGYLSFTGDMDMNIVIRTFLVKDGKAYFQVGGAVVYDSDPEAEYQETLHKGRALMQALNAVPEIVEAR